MRDFNTILADAKRYGDNRCCAPIAIALVTGKPFKTVQNWLAKLGRRKGRGTPRWMSYQALKDNGYTLRRCVGLENRYRTVRTLERAVGKRTLLVFTRRHALAIVDGKVQDWTQNRLHRIQEIYIVEKA
jgi:hypothetical protein